MRGKAERNGDERMENHPFNPSSSSLVKEPLRFLLLISETNDTSARFKYPCELKVLWKRLQFQCQPHRINEEREEVYGHGKS